MWSGSRPAFRARRTRERAVAACTGRVPPTPTIHHQLRRCLAEQSSSRSRAHGAARISRISTVIIPGSPALLVIALVQEAEDCPVGKREAVEPERSEGWRGPFRACTAGALLLSVRLPSSKVQESQFLTIFFIDPPGTRPGREAHTTPA